MPNPIDNPELYDVVIVAGEASPGVCKITGHDRKIGWDIKAGSGQSGATTTLKDVPPVEFTLTLKLVTYEDFADWPAFQALIESTVAGATPRALDIYHPDLAANDISSVVKATVGGMIHDGLGGATVAIKLLEYKPPKSKGGSPNGSKTKPKAKGADPNQAALDELARLTKQYKETPWG